MHLCYCEGEITKRVGWGCSLFTIDQYMIPQLEEMSNYKLPLSSSLKLLFCFSNCNTVSDIILCSRREA